ncbi:MipA/OmpV family protein [Alteromonadaceae bacterium BrNp21-10]|nr:MipA/OmpV family protein [Alteromonadaceae bacterium BrNp21-10]
MAKSIHKILPLLIISLVLQSMSVHAECNIDEAQCVSTNEWQLGIALGIGVKQNPLHDGDAIPLLILPDIAWYGEAAYFDNGELGYQFFNSDNMAIESFVSINDERAYFSFWHPANILFSQSQLSNSLAPDMGPEYIDGERTNISIKNISKRKWAMDAGIRWHYWQGQHQWQASMKQDISAVHDGSQLSVSYQHHWQGEQWFISIKPQLQWKSRQLLNYYYGLSGIDKVDKTFWYQVSSAWIPSITLTAMHPINDSWSWLINSSFTHLPSSMASSPIVDKNNIASAFIGVAYRF